ncbi:hypothetical protein [Dyadobacter sp. 3J3]|uniref:hypothetical protein n=1 Tax=Dyadobacter sp. 3J3 TaxID=2606600 RepID=UPI00135BC1E9|nr:hypothetical protein [Dyadobacter sp. 3J3]
MITIRKGREPREWTAKKKTEGFKEYEPIPKLRKALLKEQGNICAYCMREIPLSKRDINLSETSKIEHIKSREFHSDEQLDYDNMVICCPGCIDGNDHCDKSKKSQEISFSPFDPNVQNSITYGSKDGSIRSNREDWDRDINQILCLNNKRLKANRTSVLKGIIELLDKKHWKVAVIQQIIEEWKTPDKDGKMKPYCGIIIAFLEKRNRAI